MSINPEEIEILSEKNRDELLRGTTSGTGFEDIAGHMPKSEYYFEQGTEKSTRNAKVYNLETDVAVVAAKEDIDLIHRVSSDATNVSIKKTPKGHVVIYDDTKGSERILIKHSTGAGVEMKPDGSIIINARGNRVDLITGNHHLYSEGNGNITYSGDLNMNIGGDFNLDVGGNYNLRVGGHWIVNVFGSYTKRIIGMMAETIQKVKSTTVLKDVTNTFLGKLSTSVKKDYEFIVKGEADYNHKGSTTLTSQTEISLTSPNINVVAQDLTATGDTGTIGGENIVMFNYNMYTGHSITATDTVTTGTLYNATQVTTGHIDVPLVNGDLSGTAQNAVVGGTDTHPGSSHNFSVTTDTTADTSVNIDRGPSASDASKLKQLPTSTTTSVFLDKSAYMVQSVFVDDDDGIYNYMDKTVATAGVTDRPLTFEEIRIKMRNEINRNNTSFVKEQIANGKLSPSYIEKTPGNILRVIGKQAQARLGQKIIGSPEEQTITNRYSTSDTSRKSSKFVIPEAQYDPVKIKEIKMGTLLDIGLPVSKFFPNNETMNHLSQVERKRITRNLVPFVKLLKMAKVPGFMEGYNIRITEGVQKLGSNDLSASEDSLVKLSASGRMIALEVRDGKSGDLSPNITFDLICYLKDHAEYDKLILSYDTYEVDELSSSDKILYSCIIATMPEMPENYNVFFKQNIETRFNDIIQSNKDFAEIALSSTGAVILPDASKPSITSTGLRKIKTKKGFTTFVSAAAWDNFQGFINELESNFFIVVNAENKIYEPYEINRIEGYNTTTQRYGTMPNEYNGEDLWTANASGLGININANINLKGGILVHNFNGKPGQKGISKLAKEFGLGWGGDFQNYKDASLFSIRSEEGGTISAPRSRDVYTTSETKKEIVDAGSNQWTQEDIDAVEELRKFNESIGGGQASVKLTSGQRAYARSKGYI